MLKTKLKGFTLIELLVVISIIAILAVLIIAGLNASRSRARDSRRKQDLRSVQTGVAIYYDNEDMYPNALQYSIYDSKAALEQCTKEMDFQSGVLPHDPLCGDMTGKSCESKYRDYGYRVGYNDSTMPWPILSDGYVLGAKLESVTGKGSGLTECADTAPGGYNYCIGDYVEGMLIKPHY